MNPITTDALLTQRKLARYLVEDRAAHYLFIAKDNRPTLAQDLRPSSFATVVNPISVSLFVLGGDFWTKIRALFVYSYKICASAANQAE